MSLQYESGGARTTATDVICPMYMRPNWCLEQIEKDPAKRPVILCEYAHAMGNSGGCLSHYWGLFYDMENHKKMQGGFIWDLVDQGILLPDGSGYGYGGDFGDIPNTKQFCCNGLSDPERKPFPDLVEAKFLQSPVFVSLETKDKSELIVKILNRAFFVDTSDLSLTITLCCSNRYIPGSLRKYPSFTMPCGKIQPWKTTQLDIITYLTQLISKQKPFESVNTHIMQNFLTDYEQYAEVWLEVSITKAADHSPLSWHPEVHEIFKTSLTDNNLSAIVKDLTAKGAFESGYLSASEIQPKSLTVICPERLTSPSHAGVLNIRWSDGSYASVGKSCGRLLAWKDDHGRSLLKSPIDPCLFRAGTDNDRGGPGLAYYERWVAAGLHTLVRKVDNRNKSTIIYCKNEVDGSLVIRTVWTLVSTTTEISILCNAKYVFFCDGSIDVSVSMDLSTDSLPVLPRTGLRFSVPDSFSTVEWFGQGPHEAYDDRKASAYTGVFKAGVKDLHTNYVVPQECGRRADPR